MTPVVMMLIPLPFFNITFHVVALCVGNEQWLHSHMVTFTACRMVEPFYDQTGEGTVHTEMWAGRFTELREYALQLPKFGTDTANDEVHY